jgi:hypothetical protein
VEDCVGLGLPQKRYRQLFIGTRLDVSGFFRPTLKPELQVKNTHYDFLEVSDRRFGPV